LPYIISASKTERQNLSTESLIVELDARTAKLDAKLKNTNEKLDDLTRSSNNADSGLKKLGGGAKIVGSAILKTGAAVLALGTAVGAMVLGAANGRRELEQLSRMAKTSEQDFKALAFATSQFGINAEQIADITKDISDRVGEFVTAGTGTFQDLGDALKLTKEQTRALAVEFQDLSGEQVISRVTKELQDAGVSGDQTTTVLESLGNDLSKLKPLFADNSKELNVLKTRFEAVNGTLQITAGQAEKLQGVATSFDLLKNSFGNASTAISATLAPVVDDFFNDIIDIVPGATQTIIDFANAFLDAENITSIAGVNKEIAASLQQIADKDALIATQIGRNLQVQVKLRDEEQLRLDALNAQLIVLTEQERLADAGRNRGGQIGGESGGELSPLVMADEEEKRLEALREFTMTRAELLDSQLLADIERLELAAETFGLKDEELYAKRLELVRNFNEQKSSLENDGADDFEKASDKEVRANEKAANEKLSKQQSGIRAGMALNTLLFEDNKAISAGLIVADTAAAIMASLRINPYDYFNVGLIATTGAIQLANALSSSKGGGGSTSNPTGGGAGQQTTQPVENFNDQGATITNISDGVSTRQSLVIEFNDEVVDAISRQIQKSQSDGRT
jgi:hypothetical protein